MHDFNEKKFVFHETFTNTITGKTSGSGFIGVILGIIAGVSFIAAMIGHFLQIPGTIEVMGQIIALVAISGALLGVRKISPNFGNGHKEKSKEDTPEKG